MKFMFFSHKATPSGEHIVHIDGVTGSSPVATTINPWKHNVSKDFLVRFSPQNHQQRWWNKKALAIRNLLCYNRAGLATASKAKEVCHRR